MILMGSPGLTQSGTCLPARGQLLQGPRHGYKAAEVTSEGGKEVPLLAQAVSETLAWEECHLSLAPGGLRDS